MSASRLKVSKVSDGILFKLNRKFKVLPNILCRLAIGRSLREGPLNEELNVDKGGRELNRPTLTGKQDALYYGLVVQVAKRPLTDEEYFTRHLPLHIDRGLRLLNSEISDCENITDLVRKVVHVPGQEIGGQAGDLQSH